MTAGADPRALVWAAALCAVLALCAACGRQDAGRRARRLLEGPAPGGPGRFSPPLPWPEVIEAVARLRRWLRTRLRPVRAAASEPEADGRGSSRWIGARRSRTKEPMPRRPGLPGPQWWPLPGVGPQAVCLPLGLALGVVTRSPLPVLAGAAGWPLAGRALRRRGERAAAERRMAAVAALCGATAADLRTGRPAHTALGDAVESAGWPETPELAEEARLLLSAARFGGDVPEALRAAGRLQEGAEGLVAAAACWQVGMDGGAGLAAALDRVAAALRAEADQRDDLRAQLAGPRSTAVLLALLPVFGLLLGAGLGADPFRVLLHTRAGLFCLAAGGLLEWAGLAWTARIVRRAEHGPAPRTTAAKAADRRAA